MAAVEDVLDVYAGVPDPDGSPVCVDEFCEQQLSEVAPALPLRPAGGGHPGTRERPDAEYVREGSVSAFMIAMPHLGRREVHIGVEGRRTALDYADAIGYICDEVFPEATRIVLVQDNLNIHVCASLYKRFPPENARRLAEKLEIHHTPKHGS